MTQLLEQPTLASEGTPAVLEKAVLPTNPETPIALIADDDPDFMDQQKACLESLGFDVLTAESEAKARHLLERQKPDLALLDLMMENPDAGFTLCHQVKNEYPEVPVIMVTSAGSITGYDFESLSNHQREWIQADSVMSKPIRPEQLKRELARLLKDR